MLSRIGGFRLGRVRDILRRWGTSIAASGSVVVLVQNLLMLAAVSALVLSRGASGGQMFSASLRMDLVGIFLLGLGTLSLSLDGRALRPPGHAPSAPSRDPARIGIVSSSMCFLWVGLTLAWRVVGLGAIGSSLESASEMLSDSEYSSEEISSLFSEVRAVAIIWMLGSIVLACSSLLLVRFLRRRFGEEVSGGIAWPFFCVLNAAGTLLAGTVLALLAGGSVAFSAIALAAFLKLCAVPAVGVAASGLLSWQLIRLSRA